MLLGRLLHRPSHLAALTVVQLDCFPMPGVLLPACLSQWSAAALLAKLALLLLLVMMCHVMMCHVNKIMQCEAAMPRQRL